MHWRKRSTEWWEDSVKGTSSMCIIIYVPVYSPTTDTFNSIWWQSRAFAGLARLIYGLQAEIDKAYRLIALPSCALCPSLTIR